MGHFQGQQPKREIPHLRWRANSPIQVLFKGYVMANVPPLLICLETLGLCDSSRPWTSLIIPQGAQLSPQKRVCLLTHQVLQTDPLIFFHILLGRPERHMARNQTPRISSSDLTQHHLQEEFRIPTSSSYSFLNGSQCVT